MAGKIEEEKLKDNDFARDQNDVSSSKWGQFLSLMTYKRLLTLC